MILISHRGNITGKLSTLENRPDYIDEAIKSGFDVEVDIRYHTSLNELYLGHDEAQYKIEIAWLLERKNKLWVHCKNHEAIEYIQGADLNWFWHDCDDMTLTSKGFIWAHPKIQPPRNSIAVLPDNHAWDLALCAGICSDYIEKYKR